MRRLISAVAMASVLMLGAASVASAQSDGFNVGTLDIGPVIGLGGIGDASVSIGGRAEYGIKELPDLNNGVLSVAVSFDHYSFDSGNVCAPFGNCSVSESFTPVGVTVNYHLRLDNRKIDPFIGLGLGDDFASSSCDGSFCSGSTFSVSSGVYFIGRLGIRYYVTPKLALYADTGTGRGALHVGVMLKIKGS